jgi:hypothetical protein
MGRGWLHSRYQADSRGQFTRHPGRNGGSRLCAWASKPGCQRFRAAEAPESDQATSHRQAPRSRSSRRPLAPAPRSASSHLRGDLLRLAGDTAATAGWSTTVIAESPPPTMIVRSP